MPEYQLKLYKNFGGRGKEGGWSNTHEFTTDAALDSTAMATIVNNFADFEKAMSLANIQFIRGVVSLLDAEKDGYKPAEMRAVDISGVGLVASGSGEQVLDLNIAMDVKRFFVLGRQGHIYLRGCLLESMVQVNTNGATELTEDARTAMAARLVDAAETYFAAGKTPIAYGINKAGTTISIRQVNGLSLGNPVILKRNHKWFNRKKADGGGVTPPDET